MLFHSLILVGLSIGLNYSWSRSLQIRKGPAKKFIKTDVIDMN